MSLFFLECHFLFWYRIIMGVRGCFQKIIEHLCYSFTKLFKSCAYLEQRERASEQLLVRSPNAHGSQG